MNVNTEMLHSQHCLSCMCCDALLCRSLVIGIVISADYKISLWGLDEVGLPKSTRLLFVLICSLKYILCLMLCVMMSMLR